MTEARGKQSSDPLIELDVAEVHPIEVQYAPIAAPDDIKYIDPEDLSKKVDVCDLGRIRRCSVEQMAERELTQGVGVDPEEAFEEALTKVDLQN